MMPWLKLVQDAPLASISAAFTPETREERYAFLGIGFYIAD